MKKTFILAAAALMFSTVAKADEIQIKPVQVAQGVDISAKNAANMFEVYCVATTGRKYTSFQFDIHTPKSVPLTWDYYDEDDDETYTLKNTALNTDILTTDKGFTYTFVKLPIASSVGSDYDVYRVIIKSDMSKIVAATKLTTAAPIMKIGYGTKSAAEGVYPIYVDGIVLSDYQSSTGTLTKYTEGMSTSYVKVGSPTNASLALTGAVPTFVNTALAEETAISSLDLSKATAINGTFTYVDARDVKAPAATIKTNVAFKRAAGSATYASLCLPFEAEVNCYTLESAADGTAHFNAATTAPAGKSVLVDGKTAIDVTASDVEIAAVAEKTITSGFYVKGDKLYSVNGTAKVPACKGYWTEGAGSNMRIVIDGVTGIEEATIDANETTFDLQGRRVVNANNGLYIVNGKKQIVK